MKKKTNNAPILDDTEVITSAVKNNPTIDTNSTDASRVTNDLFIVGIDENNPRIVRQNEEDKNSTDSRMEGAVSKLIEIINRNNKEESLFDEANEQTEVIAIK